MKSKSIINNKREKMKIHLIIITLMLGACSFKPEADNNDKNQQVRKTKAMNEKLKNLDSDGDLVNDYEEGELGRDHLISNLPVLETNFLQNFRIESNYDDGSQFIVNTEIRRDDADFRFTVGKLFIYENALDNAARIGKFSGVSWGEIKGEDLNLIKFPEIDKKFVHSKLLDYSHYSKKKRTNLKISFDNVIKLKHDGIFNQIENLELNFYYKNKKENRWELLHTSIVDRVFHAGVSENLNIEIENPPIELLEENFLRNGDFIVTEIKNYYIPKLKTSYLNLMKSVKSKTIAVYSITPLEKQLNHVAVGEEGESFSTILNKVYSKNVSIKNEKLDKLDQFVSNLADFKYLYEIRENDKHGKWFVMTNKIKKHYLKHQFTSRDKIVLSYLTGEIISNRVESEVVSKHEQFLSSKNSRAVRLGKISKNSTMNLLVKANNEYGVKLDVEKGNFKFAPRSCRNCSGTDWGVYAEFNINKFRSFKSNLNSLPLNYLYDSVKLSINNQTIDLEKMLEEGDLDIEIVESSDKPFWNLKLKNFHKLKSIKFGEENMVFLSLNARSSGQESEGLKLTHVEGKNVDLIHHGGHIALTQAGKRKIPIAITGINFKKWQDKVFWGKKMRDGYIPIKGQVKTLFDGYDISFVSSIKNYFN
ncbi:MAG: hypothetical protein ACJAS4_002869 [Bacteriovoracaceae bacterium]|jgi:hypothetical protein